MTKIKEINEGEEFIFKGYVFTCSLVEGKAKFKLIRKHEGKPSKTFIPPTIDEVKGYFKEKGYSEEGAQKAFDYYTAGDWKDSGGKQVKNWKQKVLGVWMRPEYLIKKTSESTFKFQE